MHLIRCIRQACVLALGVAPALLGSAACLTRPVTSAPPDTQTIFTKTIDQSAVQRVDLLFMIDNSRSMGDKQLYLAQAVPDLLTRLITPNCVDVTDSTKIVGVSQGGQCTTGRIEFPPVHDMHIAIVTSALGSLGGDVCNDPTGAPPGPNGQNDDGQIVNRNSAVADAPEGFLAWFPSTPDNAGATPTPGTPSLGGANADTTQLVADFTHLVQGIGENGCGIEAQLESWYRFLVQPDPYASIATSGNTARLQGVDATVLKQRHDFLRPDSLLAIIDLSDENDSSVDPRAYNGTPVAGFYMNQTNTGPVRGTAACQTNPNDPACKSCFDTTAAGDPSCQKPRYDPVNDPQGYPNIRHVHMKQAYGLDFQYPMQRYVDGLTKTTVPDRDGEYPQGAQTYQGQANCSNPIFSQDLPDGTSTDPQTLCHLTPGPRTRDLVYYAHIGGVPADLLHFDPTDSSKSALSPADWTKIVGKDPAKYDYTGIDPRMVEKYEQRPYHAAPYGPYWDLAYACTFPLAAPRDCTQAANADACDCANGAPPGSVSGWELCDPNDPTKQIAAKAYPTIRELDLAQRLGNQGVVSSLCPIHVTEQGHGDPLYGYRPAMATIVDRLKGSLVGSCLPHQLTPADGSVPCLVLASLPQPGMACDASHGMSPADPQTVSRAAQTLDQADAALLDPTQHTVCQIAQVPGTDLVNGSCTQSQTAGWCYVAGAGATAGQCADAILFSPSGQPAAGVHTLLACIESTPTVTP
jgi:hypothetical protein